MKNLKIDFVCHAISGGGAERVMTLLVNEFDKKNRVRVITFNKGNSYPLNKGVSHIQLYGGISNNHSVRSFLNLLQFYSKKERRPDVVISLMPRINLISILICRFFGIKIIACEHNNHLSESSWSTHFTWNRIYPLANKVTVLTDFDRDFFEKKGVNIVVMPNPTTFEPIRETKQNREKTILVVGSLNRIHQKGWDYLIELIAPSLLKFPEWRLQIVGTGEKGEQLLKSEVKKFGVDKQVEFLGFRNDVNDLMNKSSIFLLASRFEGLPMVLIEAMSQGMACIAYNCKTGPSEIIDSEKNGILVDDQNKESFRENLEKVLEQGNFRKELQKNAPAAVEKYSMDNIISKWNQVLDEVT